MCPSSPSAWQTWAWADPSRSRSKKLSYFVKKWLLQTAPVKRDRHSRKKGGCLSLFCIIRPSMPHRRDGNGHSAPCRPAADWLSPLRSLHRSASGTARALCAKIIEACCTQDCRLSRRPEKVLNIMQNALAALTRCAIKCISCNGKFFVIPHRPPSQNKKRPDKSRVRPEGHTLPVYLYLTMCAETGANRPQNAETTR